uniref:F-box associated domain-containing protein n=1 Tax=Opuntia streptacantha TaxID=393608 RepID=A0A7C8ZJN3_OPUST
MCSYFPVLRFCHLLVLGGRLCIFNVRKTEDWVMEEYGVLASWTKFTIDVPERAEISPLCMLGREVVLKDAKKLVVYNLEERILKDINILRVGADFCSEASFAESLVSPHGTN